MSVEPVVGEIGRLDRIDEDSEPDPARAGTDHHRHRPDRRQLAARCRAGAGPVEPTRGGRPAPSGLDPARPPSMPGQPVVTRHAHRRRRRSAIAAVFIVAILISPQAVLVVVVPSSAWRRSSTSRRSPRRATDRRASSASSAASRRRSPGTGPANRRCRWCSRCASSPAAITFIGAPSLEVQPDAEHGDHHARYHLDRPDRLVRGLILRYSKGSGFPVAVRAISRSAPTRCSCSPSVSWPTTSARCSSAAPPASTPLRAWISPNKTVEGFIGGTVATHGGDGRRRRHREERQLEQPGDLIFLGLVIAIMAPLGDLTESMFKRNLDIKDFGSIVKGHGGVLDRFDGFLFTLPAAYYLRRCSSPGSPQIARPSCSRFAAPSLRDWQRMSTVRVAIAGSTGSIGARPSRSCAPRPVATRSSGSVPARPSTPSSSRRSSSARRSSPSPIRAARRGGRSAAVRRGRRRAGRSGRRRRRRRQRRRRLRRAAVTVRHAAARQAPRPGQQGEPHRRRPGGAAAAGHGGCRAGAGRQRALRRSQCLRSSSPPVARSPASCSPPAADRSAAAPPPNWPTSASTEALGPSDVEDGPEDHDRLDHADEQGPGGDRGPRAVRHLVRPDRGRRASAVGGPLDGRVHRRLDHRPAEPARHAPADRLRPRLPGRIATPFGRIDWAALGRLDFEAPDTATFRCLALAYEAGRTAGTAPAWLSAANEVAVEAFLAGRIRWPQIAEICDAVAPAHSSHVPIDGRRHHRRRRSRTSGGARRCLQS